MQKNKYFMHYNNLSGRKEEKMIIEKLDIISYRQGKSYYGFMIGLAGGVEYIKKSNKKIVILGTGDNAFFAERLLIDRGIRIDCFADNNPDLKNRTIHGVPVYYTYELFKEKEEYYFVIAVDRINDARFQFKIYGIENYSFFFGMHYFDFINLNQELDDRILKAINYIAFENEEENTALSLRIFGGTTCSNENAKRFGVVNDLLTSTGFSHWCYLWEDEYLSKNQISSIAEVGPGFGLMTLVTLLKYEGISVDWYLWGREEKRALDVGEIHFLKKIINKYSNRIRDIYGYIEKENLMDGHKYDVLIITEVFEHFRVNPVQMMKNLKSALKDDGRIFFTTPDWGHLYLYESWEELKQCEEVTLEEIQDRTINYSHIYQYSEKELREIFSLAGLKVEKYMRSYLGNHNFMLTNK